MKNKTVGWFTSEKDEFNNLNFWQVEIQKYHRSTKITWTSAKMFALLQSCQLKIEIFDQISIAITLHHIGIAIKKR